MRYPIVLAFAFVLLSTLCLYSQVPVEVGIQILKAEDARRYDSILENLMKSPNDSIRIRAALAAGRIGDEKALPALTVLMERDPSHDVKSMAAFAIGEIESSKGADAILRALKGQELPDPRAVEAAGKIAAANPKDEKSKELGQAILTALESWYKRDQLTDWAVKDLFLLELTAVLRARPVGGEKIVAKFVTNPHPRVRATALNTLTRLRAKERLNDIRALLGSDPDAIVRANAARVLGAAEDKDALEQLLNVATMDDDLRVRVAAIRSLSSLKDAKAAPNLIARGNVLVAQIKNKSAARKPSEQNELLEIATTLGQLLKNTTDLSAIKFLNDLRREMYEPEVNIALARVAPREYLNDGPPAAGYRDFRAAVGYAQGVAVIADTKDSELIAEAGEKLTAWTGGMATGVRPADQKKMLIAMPELTSAIAALKPDNIDEILRNQLTNDDLFIRAATAGLIADRPANSNNVAALETAFSTSFIKDKHDNDAVLAIMNALFKLDKKRSVGSLLVALSSPDYLVRKKAFQLLSDPEIQKSSPGIPTMLENARAKHRDQVLPYSAAFGTRLGQVLNTDIDYRRALARKNGSVRAVLTTEKGVFTIEFNPEEAPLTVDNFVKLARSGYFNGLEVHRVVPNFVMQDGDPRGDGNGSPGWSIRCEINMLPYDRGAVGMALSGKDTGGSQWFVTHSPQPHLDGGYTVFGHVSEKDMKVVDSIVRGDRILSVKIIEAGSLQGTRRTKR
jgi:cyclophilin family peptidyl-prolyl cis-trans isomerase/HEAT repeat protein